MNATNSNITVKAGETMKWFWAGKVVETVVAETFAAKVIGYTGKAAIIEFAASPNGKAIVTVE